LVQEVWQPRVRAVPIIYHGMTFHPTLPLGSVMEGLFADETGRTTDTSGYVELL
jgi:hypothetical protein